MFNAYVHPVVVRTEGRVEPGARGYRNALVDLIDGTVQETLADQDVLAITFRDARVLRVSLRPEDQIGPEAAQLAGQLSNRWGVWRSGDIGAR